MAERNIRPQMTPSTGGTQLGIPEEPPPVARSGRVPLGPPGLYGYDTGILVVAYLVANTLARAGVAHPVGDGVVSVAPPVAVPPIMLKIISGTPYSDQTAGS